MVNKLRKVQWEISLDGLNSIILCIDNKLYDHDFYFQFSKWFSWLKPVFALTWVIYVLWTNIFFQPNENLKKNNNTHQIKAVFIFILLIIYCVPPVCLVLLSLFHEFCVYTQIVKLKTVLICWFLEHLPF